MKQIKFNLNLSEKEIMETARRYHFSEDDFVALCSFFRALKPLIQGKAFYEVIRSAETRPGKLAFVEEESFFAAVVTLGNGPDRLSELYLEAGDVSAAYMIDCLSMAVLNQAYGKLAEKIAEEEKLYIEKYEFPGGRYPLETLKEILEYFSCQEVTSNDSCMLLPQKSVVYLASLTEKKEQECRHICAFCENKMCESRQALPYGYERILGKASENKDR